MDTVHKYSNASKKRMDLYYDGKLVINVDSNVDLIDLRTIKKVIEYEYCTTK